ncbi:MAG: sigma-54-dependent Fis family transcriptional regulator [Desulfobacteraceae bacterium]|nr:sigma-54-dependent Fis family transcriptional regulator [Desulfobacteraceae bacterium]
MDDFTIHILCSRQGLQKQLSGWLRNAGYRVTELLSFSELERIAEGGLSDLLILDDQLAGICSENLKTFLQSADQLPPVLLVAQKASVQRAVEVMHWGVYDYIQSDVAEHLFIDCISRVKQNFNGDAKQTCLAPPGPASIVTKAPALLKLLDTARRVAPSNATVLIQGESGTGKELLARFIHENSNRPTDRFVAMNCAALPDSLAESELFGYERGAFTGAAQRKTGRFEQADKGTLLLDEISEMPLILQAKLLRVLQEKQVDRIGGKQAVSVDTRVIATTNRDLAQMVKQGQFRQDLYYRLRVIPLTIPPLRDRIEDIPLLVEHFISKLCTAGRATKPVLSPEALSSLSQWKWPGNVRELENAIERAILISGDHTIEPEDLLLDQDMTDPSGRGDKTLVGHTVKELEKKLIEQTLSHADQNRTLAAKMLGVSIRTLRNKLREYRETQDMPCF